MESTKTETSAEHAKIAEGALDATQESLDRVRDILFGAQVRQQDQRFHDLEARLAKDLAEHREESRRRLEALEGFVKNELSALVDMLKAESAQRSEAINGIAAQAKEAAGTMERRIAGVDAAHADAERGLRQELLEQSKTLRDELAGQGATLQALLEKSAGELKHGKTDRATLASMLAEMAQRLSA